MPILRGAVTFSRFRVELPSEAPRDQKQWLTRGLRTRAFEPIDRKSDEERAAGFVEVEAHDGVEFAAGSLFYGEYALFAWRVDRLKVPASAVREELEKWTRAYELDKGQPPRRAERNAQRLAIQQFLRARATPSTHVFDVSWNLKTGQLQIWAAARKAIEEIQESIEKSFQVTLRALVPAVVAEQLGVGDSALRPTTELCWPDFDSEVSDGQA